MLSSWPGEEKSKFVIPPAPSAAQPVALHQTPADVLQVQVGSTLSEVEEAYVRLTLEHANHNKRLAAELLGICPRTLQTKLRTYEQRKNPRSAIAGVR